MVNEFNDIDDSYFEEVGFAEEFKEDVEMSKVIKFEREELKEKLLSFDDGDLVILKSEISSPKKIVYVERYDDYIDSF